MLIGIIIAFVIGMFIGAISLAAISAVLVGANADKRAKESGKAK